MAVRVLANRFLSRFSFENVPEMKDIPLSEQQVQELGDFEVSVRYLFCRDGDFVVRNGQRVFGNRDANDFDLLRRQHPNMYIGVEPLFMFWIKKKTPFFNRCVLWLLDQFISMGKFEEIEVDANYIIPVGVTIKTVTYPNGTQTSYVGKFQYEGTYEYVVAYAVKYGTTELLENMLRLIANHRNQSASVSAFCERI
jgi:hypothetical protein